MSATASCFASSDRSLLGWLRTFVLAVCLGVLVAFAWYEWSMREALLRKAETEATAQAVSLVQHAQDTFEIADTLLIGLADRLRGMERTPEAIWSVDETLANQLRLSWRIRSIMAYNEGGQQFISSQPLVPDWFDIAQTPTFEWHRRNPGADLRIGTPAQSPTNDDWIIPVTQRLDKADGSFGGVLVATIRVAYFNNFYRDLVQRSGQSVALFARDGMLLARYPLADAKIGKVYVRPDWNTEVLAKPQGALQTVSPLDGIDRVFGFATNPGYPVVQFVGIDRTTLVDAWFRQALVHASGVAALVALMHFVGSRLANQVRLRQISERELAMLARTDGLTGLANHRAFDEAYRDAVSQVSRTSTPLSLLLLDVDHFKAFNDTYGHQEGDRCLERLAAAMRSAVHRTNDVVARYGGEEFAILLPNTDEEDAILIAERVRTAVRALALPHETSRTSQVVSVSIGCSTRRPWKAADPKADLVREADRALYKAKLLGRDRIESSALSVLKASA